MKVAGNITAVAGLTVFILAGCAADSPDFYGTIALLVALAGIIITYLGYRLEEIADYICWSRNLRKKQRRKHQKVVWLLDRARQSI